MNNSANNISIAKRIDVRQVGLDDARSEYDDLWDSWKVVETKAQPIVALAGVFLAGVFAFLTDLPASASLLERLSILFVAVLLVASAGLSLAAIWVTDVGSPFLMSTKDINESADLLDASESDEELDQRFEIMLAAATNRWVGSAKSLRQGLRTKQTFLRWSLTQLALAAVFSIPWASLALFFRSPT